MKNHLLNLKLNSKGKLQPLIYQAIINILTGNVSVISAREIKLKCTELNSDIDWNKRIPAICNSMRNLIEYDFEIIGENKDNNQFSIIIKNK